MFFDLKKSIFGGSKVALKPLSRPGSHRSERFAPSLSSVAAQEPEKRAFEGHFWDF